MNRDLTLGIEEEFQIIDPASRQLCSYFSQMIDASRELRTVELRGELHQSVVEVGTPICADIREAREQVIRNRREAARVARNVGMKLGAASTHPFSHWRDQPISEGPRYQAILGEFQDLARTNLIFGLHVHVGIVDREEAIAVLNSARYFLPHILALSTSSPFMEGRDTGLKSIRNLIFRRFPRSGMPSTFSSNQEFQSFLDLLIRTGCIDDGRRIWWDIRPHPNFSTLEYRICDLPPLVDETIAIAALIQAVTAFLIKLHRNNRAWRVYRRELIEENKWRAMRYGIEAKMIDLGKQKEVPLVDLIHELLGILEEEIDELGLAPDLAYLDTILEQGTSADRQLRVWRETNDLDAVVDQICTETMQGV